MSVKSLPVSDKSRRKHMRGASSDGDVVIPLQLRRSSRWQIPGVIWKVKEPKGREPCLNPEPGTLAL